MNRMYAFAAAFALSAVFVAAPPVHSQNKSSCQVENKKYCKNVKKGQGRIYRCLRGHYKSLSPTCKTRVRATFRAQCGADAQKLCPKSGKQTAGCLRKKRAQVSAKCKNFL